METENGVVSDTEVSEKPVREQLKKASISKASGAASTAKEGVPQDLEVSDDYVDDTEAGDSRGRLHKKRSFEDLEGEEQGDTTSQPSRQANRKRSRDSTVEEAELNNGQRKSSDRPRDTSDAQTHDASNGQLKSPSTERPRTPEQTGEKRSEAAVEEMTSPKTKRSRLQSGTEENGTQEARVASSTTAAAEGSVETTTEIAPEEKPATKIPATSGFANTSATSPFASLSGSKSPSLERATSPSAFAASGFSSLSGASSGFGAIGKTAGGFGTGGSFATGVKSSIGAGDSDATAKATENAAPAATSTFGGALGQKSAFSAGASGTSAFGSSGSGFGKLGGSSGFGSSFGGGKGFGGVSSTGGLSSFASGKPSSTFASSAKPGKPFGAPKDEDEETENTGDDAEESGIKSPLSQESDKQDERFYEQQLETGEEDEVTDYSCRAKLYNYASVADGKKEWKERGLGVVRLNVKKAAPGEDGTKPKARLLMRAEGSHRVILNTPVKKEIKIGAPNGGPPQGGYVYFMGAVDGKTSLELLQLKVRSTYLHTR